MDEAAVPQWLRQAYESVIIKYTVLSTMLLCCQFQRDDDNPDVLHEGLAVLHQQPAGVSIHSDSVG